MGKGNSNRPLLGLSGGVVFWLLRLQIHEAHTAGLAFVGTVGEHVVWQTTIVAQIALPASGRLCGLQLEDLAAGPIYVHGDHLKVRGDLLRGDVFSRSGLGGGVNRCARPVEAGRGEAVLDVFHESNVFRESLRGALHLEDLVLEIWLELLKVSVDQRVVSSPCKLPYQSSKLGCKVLNIASMA